MYTTDPVADPLLQPSASSDRPVPDQPASSQKSKVDPDNPCNPGSVGHFYGGCKPCNKYNPERPDDSCKHAETCSFCHSKEHERPKHRGQRGRHALQRRQFLEAQDRMNGELRSIINSVYNVPHDTLERLKRLMKEHLHNNPTAWNDQVQFLVQRMAEIGDEAQNQRPDNARVRRARGDQAPAQVDLDSRCKWYTGTLHLMVRKMYEDQKDEKQKLEDIQKAVNASLEKFKGLEQKLKDNLKSTEGLEDEVKQAVGANGWLAQDLIVLVQKEIHKKEEKQVWDDLRSELGFMLEVTDEQSRAKMRRACKLEELYTIVRETVGEQRARILGPLEDEEDEEWSSCPGLSLADCGSLMPNPLTDMTQTKLHDRVEALCFCGHTNKKEGHIAFLASLLLHRRFELKRLMSTHTMPPKAKKMIQVEQRDCLVSGSGLFLKNDKHRVFSLSFYLQITEDSIFEASEGEDFFSKWSFFVGPDPTKGTVKFLSFEEATAQGLIHASFDRVYMGSDASEVLGPTEGRKTVRIESNEWFRNGLIVLDIDHAPVGCGTWPAFWMFGEDAQHAWPRWGEYDILESVHNRTQSATTLHTRSDCDQTDVQSHVDFSEGWVAGKYGTKAKDCFVKARHAAGKDGCQNGQSIQSYQCRVASEEQAPNEFTNQGCGQNQSGPFPAAVLTQGSDRVLAVLVSMQNMQGLMAPSGGR
ncbi:unnamed protein product [Symbiodinium natans]|uniref:GH16 domain-containing protein n=1 Tax=Symbiodinium natans TaxID=878477 RepID=A0A812I4T4_9DINO|nr:unnamed protein product [Symbiodinium natans]